MTAIRPVCTDADYEGWREVLVAIHPQERCPSVAELRDVEAPKRLLLIAKLDGKVVGTGLSDRSVLADRALVMVRVLPDARRQGIGSELLHALSHHAVAQGYEIATAGLDDEGSLAFAQRLGFVETRREVEQVRRVVAESWPESARLYDIVSVAERPELWAKAYEQVALPTFSDMDVPVWPAVSGEEWAELWINDPEAMFMAVVCDEVIGVAGLLVDADRPERAEVAYTGVRQEWRRRGVASNLKRTSMAWAADRGITEIYSWTQQGNENVRALNERLGFTYGAISIKVQATLPLHLPCAWPR
ncbi:GNAT family N-acetyltransferase [Kribbella turkmenica]|uniref:GNAT family N-acetyltransferase n=1 Tax=Kribbella turkmenica TaxID=2530375 RepID=A0A4R4XEP6_9ACTN|nr:GNAT family N-acetyltransferase [Kribbella turkmenica]TDD29216.1 GNAT family N-acetyltransferase [Kribbella turkmenica]